MHLNDESLYFIFTDVTELFYAHFKLIFFLSIQITLWYFFYYLFSFLAPALHLHEFSLASFLFQSGTFFWFLAVCLSSYVLIPFGWNFFLSFQSQQGFYFEARISEYFNFYTQVYLLALTYGQLLTFFFLFLNDIKKSRIYVKKYRKLYYYGFLIFSTAVTPPDLISQIITTFLILIIFELVLFFSLAKCWIR
jgi:sec-independent protein translocase protein TatC